MIGLGLGFGLGLTRNSGVFRGLDPDAKAYIAAVETEDGQALESGVRKAINNFVVGCKSDGIWDAIKASCILAGARTLDGALVPLVGTAPTNNNFVSGDYNRETGLVGDGSTKYLDSNRNNNADPQDSNHNAVYLTGLGTVSATRIIGGNSNTYATGDNVLGFVISSGERVFVRSRNVSGASSLGVTQANSFLGVSRSLSSSFNHRISGVTATTSQVSQTPSSADIRVFCGGSGAEAVTAPFDGSISFYSIGESLDLAALDTRVSTLMEQIFKGIYGIDFDNDAYAYITKIRSSGASVDSTQINAINTFVKTGKSDGWYSSLKRLYLPIWASAAPNAVDMVTRASGTFNGTVTHSSGYVQGDGSTGNFIFDSNMSSLGMTLEDHMLFFGNYSGPTPTTLIGHIGNRAGGTLHGISLATVSGSIRIYTANSITNSSATLSEANTVGIIMGRRTGSNVSIRQRRGSGFSTLVATTSTPDGSLPDIPMYSLRSNFINNDSQVFCSGCAAGMDTNGEESFSLALKNLWETATGLSLP